MADDMTKIWDMIDNEPTCMMTTVDPQGELHARPMHAIAERESHTIWMFTELVSGKSAELERDGKVCLAFSWPSKGDYVSVSGEAEVTQDRERIHKYWNRFVQAWFTEGPDGANVALIRVTPRKGEYWDTQSSKVVRAVKQLAASGSDGRPNLGEHGSASRL